MPSGAKFLVIMDCIIPSFSKSPTPFRDKRVQGLAGVPRVDQACSQSLSLIVEAIPLATRQKYVRLYPDAKFICTFLEIAQQCQQPQFGASHTEV
jgi:hypothetical protein